jgi:hypothetical protein
MLTVLGWLSRAASSASALNRRTSPGLAELGPQHRDRDRALEQICSPR